MQVAAINDPATSVRGALSLVNRLSHSRAIRSCSDLGCPRSLPLPWYLPRRSADGANYSGKLAILPNLIFLDRLIACWTAGRLESSW